MFMLLFFVWGWVILLVLAAVLAAKLPWKAGLPLAGGLVLLALPWFWAMRSATFGHPARIGHLPGGLRGLVRAPGLLDLHRARAKVRPDV